MYNLAKNIADIRIKKRYTQKELAEALKVSKGTITSYEGGTRVPPIEKLQEMANLFKIKITDFFIEDVEKIDFLNPEEFNFKIPIVSHASAGTGKEVFDNDEILDVLELPDKISKKVDFATYVEGDSMSPRILDGNIILIRKDVILEDGDIGLFNLNNLIYVKKIKYNPFTKKTTLVSINKDYDPIPVNANDEFKILGKVVCKIDYNF